MFEDDEMKDISQIDAVENGAVAVAGDADVLAFSMSDVDMEDGDLPYEKPKIVYHITDFDGPLDLLYQQIKDAKIDIEDIFISDITSQYVQIINNAPKEELDYEYAGEFISSRSGHSRKRMMRNSPRTIPPTRGSFSSTSSNSMRF